MAYIFKINLTRIKINPPKLKINPNLYHTEDILDQISSEEKRRVQNLKLKMETNMEEIFDRIDSLVKQRVELGLTEGKRYKMKLTKVIFEEFTS